MLRPKNDYGRSLAEATIGKNERQIIRELSKKLLSGEISQDEADTLAQIPGKKVLGVLLRVARGKCRTADRWVAGRALRLRPERQAGELYYRYVLNAIDRWCGVFPFPQQQVSERVSEDEILELGNRTDRASLQLLKDIIHFRKEVWHTYLDLSTPLGLRTDHFFARLPVTRWAAFRALHSRLGPGGFAEFAEEIAFSHPDPKDEGDVEQQRIVLCALVTSLADIPEQESVEIAESLVKSPDVSIDFRVREDLLSVLGNMKASKAVGLLSLILENEYPESSSGNTSGYGTHQDAAFQALQKRAEPEVTLLIGRALMKMAPGDDPKMAVQYCGILEERQDACVVDAWRYAAGSENVTAAVHAIGALSKIALEAGKERCVDILEKILRTSTQRSILSAAADGLATFGDQVFDVWDRALDIENAYVRSRALDYFTTSQEARAVESLGRALEDPDPRIRRSAVNGLGERNEQAAVQLLKQKAARGDTDPLVCLRLAGVLTSHDEFQCSASLLSREMAGWDPGTRASAMKALSGNTDPEALKLLGGGLYDGAKWVRLSAVKALSTLGGQTASGLLRQKLRSGDSSIGVSLALCEAVGAGEDFSLVFPIVSRAIASDTPEQRMEAINILSRRKERQALELLRSIAPRGENNPAVLKALVSALADRI